MLEKSFRRFAKSLLVRVTTLEALYGDKLEKLHPIPTETVATPESKHMSFNDIGERYLKRATYTTPDIYTTVLHGVLYSPDHNVLLTKSRKLILDSFITGQEPDLVSFSEAFRRPVKLIPGCSSIFRFHHPGYYHTLIVEPPRVHLLNQPEYADFDEIKLLCPNGLKKVEEFILPKLAPSNIKFTPVSTGYLYYLETVIFPSFVTKRSCGYLPSSYLKKFQIAILPQRPRQRKNRIFISRIKCVRPDGNGRHILNEEELLEVLKPHGFERYELENLSISEIIELFYDAEIVIGAHGAGLANLVFSDQVSVLEMHPRKFFTPTYYYLCKSLGHDYHHWCADIDLPHNTIDFKIDVSIVSEHIFDVFRLRQ